MTIKLVSIYNPQNLPYLKLKWVVKMSLKRIWIKCEKTGEDTDIGMSVGLIASNPRRTHTFSLVC